MGNSTRITIRRPDGTIETVIHRETFGKVIEQQMIVATRNAGRGEILSFEIISPDESNEQRLRRERQDLVSTIRGEIEEQAHAFEVADAREDVMAWVIKDRHEPSIAAAHEALAAFDAAHPDLIAQIRTEQTEATDRFLRSD
jgi:hypothetical protein